VGNPLRFIFGTPDQARAERINAKLQRGILNKPSRIRPAAKIIRHPPPAPSKIPRAWNEEREGGGAGRGGAAGARLSDRRESRDAATREKKRAAALAHARTRARANLSRPAY